MFSDTTLDTVLVLLIGGAVLRGATAFVHWYQERKDQEEMLARLKRLERARSAPEVIEPQTGFPVGPGVVIGRKR